MLSRRGRRRGEAATGSPHPANDVIDRTGDRARNSR
jgi:hypothetical protein